jgi:hypothetical protein
LSDLANSCEYLTSENLCLAVIDNEKSKASRQVRCKNDEKSTCCYLCMLVFDCANPCRFLGSAENESHPIDVEKTSIDSKLIDEEKKPEMDKWEKSDVAWCSMCNVEMSQAKTKFRIDGSEGSLGKLGEKELPVIVFLCPKCGKIEFKADKL